MHLQAPGAGQVGVVIRPEHFALMAMAAGPSHLVVRTSCRFRSPPATVWPLLYSSKMDRSSSLLFKLGVPQPLECRLTDGVGGVGGERECVSDQGVVHQRITAWTPEKELSFRMERTDVVSARLVREVEETFNLISTRRGLLVTRTTRVVLNGPCPLVTKIQLFVGLKQVHRYVFRNWQRLAKEHDRARDAGVPGDQSRSPSARS